MFLHGEILSREQAADAAGGSIGLVYPVMALMKEWGFRFEDLRGPEGIRFRLLNRDHVPVEHTPHTPTKRKKTAKPGKHVERARPRERAQRAPEVPADTSPVGSVPTLDQALKVHLIYRDPKTQEIKVGLHNGTSSWLCTVDAHVDGVGSPI